MSKRRVQTLRLCWLEAFLAVIDNEGVEAKAAEAMGVSASRVSRAIAGLGGWVRTPLFDADFPRGLTDHGRKFEDVARTVVSSLNDMRMVLPDKAPHFPPQSARHIKIKRGPSNA